MTKDVGGDRRYPSASGANDLDLSTAAPTIAAHLNVRPGDRIRYNGSWDVCEAEVIEVHERVLLVRRDPTFHTTWDSRGGGVKPIRRERVIEIITTDGAS